MIGAGVGFLFSSGEGQNVSIGNTTAQSGFLNNYLSHDQLSEYFVAFKECETDDCKREVNEEYLNLSLEQQHELAMCGNDLMCLAPHFQAMVEARKHPGWQNLIDMAQTPRGNLIGSLEFQAHQVYLDYAIDQDLPWLLKPFEWPDPNYVSAYVGYTDWANVNCAGISGADCMQRFQRGPAHADLFGQGFGFGAKAFATSAVIGLGGGLSIAVAPEALAAMRTCATSPTCWNQLTAFGGELSLGISGATAGQTFYTVGAAGTALAGRLVLKHGDEILSVVDDLGRYFTPVSQSLDDSGRFIVQAADGTIGYLDDAARFVPTGPNRTGTVWDNIVATADNIPGTRIPATFEVRAGNQSFWVNANATEHFGEYLTRYGASGDPISAQQMLRSFQSAVDDIARSGPPTLGQPYNVGGWEIVFRQSPTDRLPVIVHAFPTQMRQ